MAESSTPTSLSWTVAQGRSGLVDPGLRESVPRLPVLLSMHDEHLFAERAPAPARTATS
jgi:hypothetical protein